MPLHAGSAPVLRDAERPLVVCRVIRQVQEGCHQADALAANLGAKAAGAHERVRVQELLKVLREPQVA